MTIMSASSPVPAPDHFYLCYRCLRCTRLITKLEMLEWRAAADGRGRPNICPCGSGRISATNPTDEESERMLSVWQLIRFLRGSRGPATRLWHLRLAVMASPPHESLWQRLFSRVWRAFGGRLVFPPPPPPNPEDVEFAERAKFAAEALDRRIAEVAAKLKSDDISLEEALVRNVDEEVGR